MRIRSEIRFLYRSISYISVTNTFISSFFIQETFIHCLLWSGYSDTHKRYSREDSVWILKDFFS